MAAAVPPRARKTAAKAPAKKATAAQRRKADDPAPLLLRRGRQAGEDADIDEVRSWAADLPDKYIHCRARNHAWDDYTAGRHEDGGWEQTLRCPRCDARKILHLSESGMVIGSPYIDYPDGYLHEGFGRIVGDARGVLRIESLTRTLLKQAKG